MRPEPMNIHPLLAESGISQGIVDTSEVTAAPPATAVMAAGNAQQSSVPVDVNSARKLARLCFVAALVDDMSLPECSTFV